MDVLPEIVPAEEDVPLYISVITESAKRLQQSADQSKKRTQMLHALTQAFSAQKPEVLHELLNDGDE